MLDYRLRIFCIPVLFLASVDVFGQALPLGGGDTAPAEQPAAPPAVDSKMLIKRGNPRACVETFLEACRNNDYPTAIECLDFGEAPETASLTKKETAYELFQLLTTLWKVDVSQIPKETEDLEVTLQDSLEWVGAEQEEIASQISLIKGNNGLWTFDPETVVQVHEWAEKFSSQIRFYEEQQIASGEQVAQPTPTFAIWLERQMPEKYRQVVFLLPTYQWFCLLTVIVAGFLADSLTRWSMRIILHLRFGRTAGEEEIRKAFVAVWRPIGLLVLALVWWLGLSLFRLPPMFRTIMFTAVQFLSVFAAIWVVFRIIDLCIVFLIHSASRRGRKYDDLLLPLAGKSLKTFAICVGVLVMAESFDLPLVGLLGSLGIGGIAIALAAKETVSNVFGSITVMIDRPFEIGDWIVTEGVEGIVEQMGLRSTKIRTGANSLVTVPNSLLITAKVDNLGRRQYRLVRTTLGIQYDTTPEQINAFCEGIRELIRRHPYTRKDYYQVYLNQFNSSSLDIFLNLYLDVNDWSVELREKHNLYVDIVKLAKRLGIQFAFPTQTIHLYNEEASTYPGADELPTETGRRAAAEIAGPLPKPNERPGLVDFPGPHHYDDIDARRRKRQS